MQVKAKKSLGQNFLTDKKIISKIVSATEIEGKNILEIGPGTGNLTESILSKKPKKLFVIEKDIHLCEMLYKKFKSQITIFNEDILKFDLEKFKNDDFTVFGNLPYNISSKIISKFVNNSDTILFNDLILMFQKEVGDRILANVNTPSYGRLTILLNWRLNIKKICDIKPSSFSPKPKVDSSLIHFTFKEKFFPISNIKNLETITRIFFNQRRKKIKRPFKQIFQNFEDISNELEIDLNLRPQNLDVETFCKITEKYENLIS